MEYWTIALQVLTVLALGYYYLSRKYTYWTDRGISGPPPTLAFGNLWDLLRHGQVKKEVEWVQKYGKTYGMYQGFVPRYTVADAELIKTVLVKDFAVFVNRDINRFDHEIWTANLFNAESEQWRRIRAITSPSFTTGKLKGMHGLMNRAVEKLGTYFSNQIAKSNGEMNIKEVITGFTVDVIASTSFATDTNANGDRSGSNVFLENSINLLDFKAWILISFFAMPKSFNRLIGAELGFNMKPFQFFVDLSKAIIKQRQAEKDSKAKRSDLVQLMLDAFVYEDELQEKNYDKLTATADNDEHIETNEKVTAGSIRRQLTENEIIAQCILFFVAGFETTATTLSNALYHLAIHPEKQSKLAEELHQALDGIEVDSTEYFDKVNNHIPYLEATIKETLRMCPPVVRLQRRVGIDGYKLAGQPLEKDTHVDLAVYAVHHSSEYYEDPDSFVPERFMPENKHKLVPYTYLPFGAGPRNCIGMRFAYTEIRLCLAKIVREFAFSTTPKTKVPLEYNKFGILSCKDIPLKVSRRV